MLVEAFLQEAVEGVADPTARAALEDAIAGWRGTQEASGA